MRVKRKMSEREYQEHLRTQERARRALQFGGNPSLRTQRDHYRRMADDPAATPREREQWRLLADELTRRLGDETGGRDQERLPF